jgi:hypothetical protein
LIIISAFNDENQIERLLYGITQQTAEDVEIIVIWKRTTERKLALIEYGEAGSS